MSAARQHTARAASCHGDRALEEQPIGKCHVVGHDFVLRRLGAIAEPRVDNDLELFARRLQKLELPQHPKMGHVGNIVAEASASCARSKAWSIMASSSTDRPQFELTRRVVGHDQRGQNRPPAANQMLTKHLTKSLTENAHRNKTASKHRRPTRPFEPDTHSHHRNNR